MSTVSEAAGSGLVVKVPDLQKSAYSYALIVNTFPYDIPESSGYTNGLNFGGYIFAIPNTKAGEDYIVRFKISRFNYKTTGTGYMFSDDVHMSMIYCDTVALGDTNYKSSRNSSLTDKEVVFRVSAQESQTVIYFYLRVYGSVYYSCPLIPSHTNWGSNVAIMSVDFSDISYEKVVGGDDLLSESKKQTEIQEEISDTQKNIFVQISDFFSGFFDGIINAFISLFVPDDDFFSDYFSRLNGFFSEKLGFLYVPVELLVEVIEGISNASSSPPGIEFPGIEWDGQYIIEPQVFNFSTIFGEMPGLQDAIYLGTDVIMIGALLLLLQNKLKEVLEK